MSWPANDDRMMGLPRVESEDDCPEWGLQHDDRGDDQGENHPEPLDLQEVEGVDGEGGEEQDPGEVEPQPGQEQQSRPQHRI